MSGKRKTRSQAAAETQIDESPVIKVAKDTPAASKKAKAADKSAEPKAANKAAESKAAGKAAEASTPEPDDTNAAPAAAAQVDNSTTKSKDVGASKAAKAPAGKLAAGQQCPDFEVVTDEGESVKLSDLVRERGAVIFVYPRANTPGCTKQACGFRDGFAAIDAAGYSVFGMSADNPAPQANWRAKHSMPFTLLCDKSKKALKALGFVNGDKIKRSHVVVGKGGVIEQYCPGVSPGDSVSLATEFCTKGK